MKKVLTIVVAGLVIIPALAPAEGVCGRKKDKVRYEKRYRDPVLKSMATSKRYRNNLERTCF